MFLVVVQFSRYPQDNPQKKTKNKLGFSWKLSKINERIIRKIFINMHYQNTLSLYVYQTADKITITLNQTYQLIKPKRILNFHDNMISKKKSRNNSILRNRQSSLMEISLTELCSNPVRLRFNNRMNYSAELWGNCENTGFSWY